MTIPFEEPPGDWRLLRARPELAEGANGHVRKFATHETVRAEAIRIMNEVFRPSGATCCLCGIEHFI